MSSPAHDALDRLESWLDQDSREDAATVRERLDTLTAQVEQLTQERDAALDREAGTHDALDDLRLENDALTLNARATDHARKTDNSYLIARAEAAEAENARLTEGLREIERYEDGSKGVEHCADMARALLSANPPQGDAAAGSSPSDDDPPCPGCGMTAQVEASRSEPGRWMCHGCAQMFDSPSDGGGAK